MLRIKIFIYCSDFWNMIEIKVQKSKSNFSNNNDEKIIQIKDFIKQN